MNDCHQPTDPDSRRYAVYFAPPPRSEWWRFGREWLGRDPISGDAWPQPRVPGLPKERQEALTADAQRYGFHATLKPPFRLATGHTSDELHAALVNLAKTHSPFALGALDIGMLGSFIALRPREVPAELPRLARACVEYLDPLRALSAAAELERRRVGLTPRQDELLARWGYPYVLEEWRFHMTLTGSLARQEAAPIIEWLHPRIARLNAEPLFVDALCLFEQMEAKAPFRLIRRYGFDGSVFNHGISRAVALSG